MPIDTVPSYVPPIPVLTITWPVVRKLLVETVEALTGLARGRVLVETLADRRPADTAPYCTLYFRDIEPLPVNEGDWYFDSADDITIDATQVHDNESLATVRIMFWGAEAFFEATKLMQAFHAQRRFNDLWQLIGFAGFDMVQDISTEYNGQIQQRAFFNMQFYVCLGRAFPADWFKVSQWEIQKPDSNGFTTGVFQLPGDESWPCP